MKKSILLLSLILFIAFFATGNLLSQNKPKTQSWGKIKADIKYLYVNYCEIPVEALIYIDDVVIAQAKVRKIKRKCILVEEIYKDIDNNTIYRGYLKFSKSGRLKEIIKKEGNESSPRLFRKWPVTNPFYTTKGGVL